ncbi:hypothetical protein OG252_13345 [Streptomyces sp. NBC_01352]|uniref:hypothetical protein n=1 Tax=Streptomyces sp. NBC_01352 TaxID=2903834 RepID=UPI002E37A3E5|nr:hypothetical protein [Streptomyces sp. NBC_01352]
MTREQILSLPQPLRWVVQVVAPTGQHRPVRPAGALVDTQFVHCVPCGVESAATRHGDALRCAEGHTVPAGGVS